METSVSPEKPVLRTALVYGVGAGVICALWIVGLYWAGNNPYGPKRLMAIFVPPIAVLLGQWKLRQYYKPDGPGLLRSVGTGLLITFFASVVSGASVYTFARSTGPEPIARHLAEMRHLLEQAKPMFLKEKSGRKQYEQAYRNLAFSAQDLATDDYVRKFLVGLLISIPGGIFLRK
ncbi:DUF4199 domain-containing protein [Hymenobacter volaticus]|uniref:DUF4199 domain-containing protein n=1 Tax=Hymenobacter volaticus TaxID=2932254 RepID=A0ABY4G2N3_9BACT|nr:DUF4199 domain-containing protein [Hymenobacter volaticus]UOQ65088.1 DUF4199 domain-containing protein [Hymenobacter volaticus]